jgi:hypothetical protein
MKTAKTLSTILTVVMVYSLNAYAITPKDWVDAHNKYRRRHMDTPDVIWDSDLAAEAQACANLKPGTKPQPRSNGDHCNSGENWASGTSSAESVVGGQWYDEIDKYDYSNPVFSQETGHFTQVVWKDSIKIGCATGYGSVCRYEPFGNYKGQFAENVKPLKPIGGNILWYHNLGVVGVWYMNGTNYVSWAFIGYADPSWQVAGAADFDRNGSTDILWRNYETGENVVWHMAGSQIKSTSSLEKVSDVGWKIVGTGDFNGDGLTDILWRHATRGYTLVWPMDGVKRIGHKYLPSSTNRDWKIVSTGDFNADYTTDILWRNTSTGANAVWYLKNGEYDFMRFIEGAQTDWEVGATGDLNKDRKTDILWRNKKTGANYVWYANENWSAKNGQNFSSGAWLPPVSDLNFKMVGTGNFK